MRLRAPLAATLAIALDGLSGTRRLIPKESWTHDCVVLVLAGVLLSSGMGSISVACYQPKPGCEGALLDLVRVHLPPLRAQGLVTERTSIVMRTADGTIIEIFEWTSREAVAGAHTNPVVLSLWKQFEAVCSYVTPSSLAEFGNLFAHFEPV
jgi:hypothetical protein